MIDLATVTVAGHSLSQLIESVATKQLISTFGIGISKLSKLVGEDPYSRAMVQAFEGFAMAVLTHLESLGYEEDEIEKWAVGVAALIGDPSVADELWQPVIGLGDERAPDVQVLEETWTRLGPGELSNIRWGMVAAAYRRKVERQLIVGPELRSQLQIETLIALRKEATGSRLLHPYGDLEQHGQARPLSFAQQRLWFLDRLAPGDAQYNIPTAVRFKGALDVAALERAFAEVVRRHEILRTTFSEESGVPLQVIHPLASWTLSVIDVSVLVGCQRSQDFLQQLADAEATRPFDLERGPLLRSRLLRLADEDHLLVATMHHIVADRWSIGVMLRELSALYRGEALPEPAIQYSDFAVWQRRRLRGEVLQAQLAHWRERLADLPVLELPTDHPRPAVMSHRGATVEERFAAPLAAHLATVGHGYGATLFMTLLAALTVALERLSGQHDFAVGTPVAGRTNRVLEDLIGLFVNTLVLRQKPTPRASFAELLAQVRRTVLNAHEHQDVPFEQVVSVLAPGDLSRPPLFQVVFSLVEEQLPVALPDVAVSPWPLRQESVKFELDVALTLRDGKLALTIGYGTDLFDRTTILRLVRGFATLLAAVAEAPEKPVMSIALLLPSERQQLLVEWNETSGARDGEALVHELFAAQARARPDAVALQDGDAILSYGELARRVRDLAWRLRFLGVRCEERVGISLKRSFDMVIAVVASLEAGGVYVPLDPTYPAERLRFMLEDAKASVVLTTSDLAARLLETAATVVELDGLDLPHMTGAPAIVRDPSRTAYVIYTSGSTSRPKGVEVPHRAIARLVVNASFAELDASQALLLASPLAFDASTFELWGALLQGGRSVLLPPEIPSPELLRERITSGRVTTMWLTSSLFNAVVDQDPTALGAVRQLLIGGEALSVPRVREYRRHHPGTRLVNGYGPTENTTFTCCYDIPSWGAVASQKSIPIGRAIGGSEILLLGSDLSPSPLGGVGELVARGAGLARGYAGRPALTAEKFIPDPTSSEPGGRLYRTGDQVRYLADGRVDFIGRVDHQVKVRGYRVELSEIEAVLAEHPGVRAAAVVARDDRLVAFVTGAAEESSDLRDVLRERLPGYMVPSLVVEVASLPRLGSGKMDRGALYRSRSLGLPRRPDLPSRSKCYSRGTRRPRDPP